jgi:NADH-quinone oxidoreductase subunit D
VFEAEPTIGYIHTRLKKLRKIVLLPNHTSYRPMNYCSSPINNMGWWMTLEKLLDVEVPKRAQYLRVIVMELENYGSPYL